MIADSQKPDKRTSEKRAFAKIARPQKELQKQKRPFMTMEALYSSIFTQTSYVIFTRTLEGEILAVNQQAVDLFGYTTAKEMIGRHVSQFLSPASFKTLMKEQQKWIRDQCIKRQYYEHEISRKNGEKMIVESAPSLIKENAQIVGIMAIARNITGQRQRQKNMQFYLAEITRAQEEERKHIACELHDVFSQDLATISLKIDMLTRGKEIMSQETLSRLKQVQGSVNDMAKNIRLFAQELRPDALEQLGMVPILANLINEMHNEEKEINIRFEIAGTQRRLSPETELTLFRVAQEALRNVKKHAMAIEVLVKIEFAPDEVSLTVVDNGRGFRVPKVAGAFAGKGKLGLIGMQERAHLLGGTFSVKSQVGKGTEITVEVKA